jgi:hypothetical protein
LGGGDVVDGAFGIGLDALPARHVQQLDFVFHAFDNQGLKKTGRIQNGAVILDAPLALPDGTLVCVTVRSSAKVHVAENPVRLQFPLVRSAAPGSVGLTAERIGEILEEEDLETIRR